MFLTFESLGGMGTFIILMIVALAVLKFGLPILKQIIAPVSKVHEFATAQKQEESFQEKEITEETDEERKERKQKGCLRIVLIGIGVILLSGMICTVGMKLLLKDSLSENLKLEIIQLVENDEQLKDKFNISRVQGNQFYLKLDLEFLQKPQSTENVKHWTRYVCEGCKEIIKKHELSSSSINIAAVEKISETETFIFGVMSYNSFSNSYNFLEMNEVR